MSGMLGNQLEDPEPLQGALYVANAEESFYTWDQMETVIKIIICILVIIYLITGVVFLIHYKYLCKGMSQMWIFCLIVELVPICYAALVESILPSWNPANAWKRQAAYTSCGFLFMTYACIVLYTPDIECTQAGHSKLNIWVQVTFYLLASLVVISLGNAIFKSMIGDKAKKRDDDDIEDNNGRTRVDDSTPLLHEN